MKGNESAAASWRPRTQQKLGGAQANGGRLLTIEASMLKPERSGLRSKYYGSERIRSPPHYKLNFLHLALQARGDKMISKILGHIRSALVLTHHHKLLLVHPIIFLCIEHNINIAAYACRRTQNRCTLGCIAPDVVC